MLRPRAAVVAIPVVLLLAGPASASAHTFLLRYPSHTIRYFDASPYHRQVRAAAAAWNRSGARIHWAAVPRSRARVVIQLSPSLPTAGLAYSNTGGGGWIRLQKHLGEPNLGPDAGLTLGEQVVAHEMGHIMGLGHETRRCAVMSPHIDYRGSPRCRLARERWRRRCRILERDDIAGAVKLFGGRVRLAKGSPFCAVGPAPGAPTNVRVSEAPAKAESYEVTLAWRNPAGPRGATVDVSRRAESCPTGDKDPKATHVATAYVGGSRDQTSFDGVPGLSPGRWCYRLVVRTALGQPGKAATAFLDYRGRPPFASFRSEFDETDPNTVRFEDSSSDPDGKVVAWSWDFGDGTTGTGPAPSHRYAAPGTYTVTLAVTDNSGATGTSSDTVDIEAPGPEE